MAIELPEKIVAVHASLDAAGLSHAFGGALALAWCTGRPRGTIDVDVNVFVDVARAAEALAGMPAAVSVSQADVDRARADGQVRVWWEATPIDVFLNTTEFHEQVARRARTEPFLGESLPFVACGDLAVFKAFFDRTQDWADLEAMVDARTIDVAPVLGTLVLYLGGGDPRIARFRNLAAREDS